MSQEKLSNQIYQKVSQKIALTLIDDFKDLETITAPDGRQVGSFKAFQGEKLEKFSLAELSLAPRYGLYKCKLKTLGTVQYSKVFM